MKRDKQPTSIEELEDQTKFAELCGGTVASDRLRNALEQKRRLESVIEIWRAVLENHNAQTTKFIEYEIETGKPKDRK